MVQKREIWLLVLLWAVVTAAGVAFSASVGIFPSPGSREALVVDQAMNVMAVLAVPVFTMVVILLVYSVLRFRQAGGPVDDGPPIRGNRRLEVIWVAVSTLLVLFLAGYGSFELLSLRAHAEGHAEDELVVQVTGRKWFWEFTYPQYGVKAFELRLPKERPARFEITSIDVLHSFWIPAFRNKIDAVPGLTTMVSATPTRLGSSQEDVNFRLQCAQLCGTGHANMRASVTILEPADFESWVKQQPPLPQVGR